MIDQDRIEAAKALGKKSATHEGRAELAHFGKPGEAGYVAASPDDSFDDVVRRVDERAKLGGPIVVIFVAHGELRAMHFEHQYTTRVRQPGSPIHREVTLAEMYRRYAHPNQLTEFEVDAPKVMAFA